MSSLIKKIPTSNYAHYSRAELREALLTKTKGCTLTRKRY